MYGKILKKMRGFYHNTEVIKVITGVRRCGKSIQSDENMVYISARSRDYSVSVGRIGKLECDFILRDTELNYAYVQVAYTINESQSTEDREYAPLEMVHDNYPKYVLTTDYPLQKRNGIHHVNLLEFMKANEKF